MKRRKVTKTFVKKECSAVRASLKNYCDARIAGELDNFAGILQGTLKDIERRLARIEEQLSSIESGL